MFYYQLHRAVLMDSFGFLRASLDEGTSSPAQLRTASIEGTI